MALDPIEKYLGENVEDLKNKYPTNREIISLMGKKFEEQGYKHWGYNSYKKTVTDNKGNKYDFIIKVQVSLFDKDRHYHDEELKNWIFLDLWVYRDKPLPFLKRLFSKEKTEDELLEKFSLSGKTQKSLTNHLNFEDPLELRKGILRIAPTSIKSLEKVNLDRINRMPDPSTLKENMNEKSRWAKLAGLPEPKELLNENIGGVVSIGAINNIFDREKEKYEDAFEHFLSERYGHDAPKDEEYGDEPDWIEDEDSTSYPSHPTDGSPEDTSMPSWMMEDMYSSNEPHFSPRELKAAFLYAFESAQKNPDMNVEMAFRAWQDIPKLD